MVEQEAEEELLAAQARFRALAAEWDLGPTLAARLLGKQREDLGLDLVPRVMDCDAERRMRLLLSVRSLLPAIAPDVRDVPVILRRVDPEDPASGSLLDLMSGPTSCLSAVVAALSARAALPLVGLAC